MVWVIPMVADCKQKSQRSTNGPYRSAALCCSSKNSFGDNKKRKKWIVSMIRRKNVLKSQQTLNQRRAKHQHQHYDPPKREDEENPNTTSHYSWQASQGSDNTSQPICSWGRLKRSAVGSRQAHWKNEYGTKETEKISRFFWLLWIFCINMVMHL